MLELMALGLGNKEIAQRLTLGRRTVETHIDHVLRKLDVPTRSRAVSEAVRFGLLSKPSGLSEAGSQKISPNNLPFQLTPLLGREEDLVILTALIESSRLVTVSGAGGIGKTRVALRLGADTLNAYPDGVWFCEFSPISNGELVGSLVAKVLDVLQKAQTSLAESIVRTLRRKRTLLIFDNCEHVLDAAAELADEVLHHCSNVRVLATSRQSLGIIGEVVHRLPSLAVPPTTSGLDSDHVRRYAAIELFLDRARASDSRFTFGEGEVQALAEICRRLDGIPLAIELAATRVNMMSLLSLARGLDDRFQMLASGNRTALPRHKTLTALISWSYDLLDAQEQRFFRRMSVFRGSFSLDAAGEVCCEAAGPGESAVDLLSSLIDKSLVVVDTSPQDQRYRLLESTRDFASKKLGEAAELDRIVLRHAVYYRDRVVEADRSWGVGSTGACLRFMELELDNFRAAMEWALSERGDAAIGGAVAAALQSLWVEGLSVEGRYWVLRAQQHLGERSQPSVAGNLWRTRAKLTSGRQKLDCATRALRLFETVGDNHGIVRALASVAFALLQTGQLQESRHAADRALEISQRADDRAGIAMSLHWDATLSSHIDGAAVARKRFMKALRAFRELGDEVGMANVLLNWSESEFAAGHTEEALRLVAEAVAIHSRAKEESFPIALANIGVYRIALGDLDQARVALRTSLPLSRHRDDSAHVAIVLQHFALAGAISGDFKEAAQLLAFVNLRCKELGIERQPTEQWGYDRLMSILREHLTPAEFEQIESGSSTWSEDEAVAEAMAL